MQVDRRQYPRYEVLAEQLMSVKLYISPSVVLNAQVLEISKNSVSIGLSHMDPPAPLGREIRADFFHNNVLLKSTAVNVVSSREQHGVEWHCYFDTDDGRAVAWMIISIIGGKAHSFKAQDPKAIVVGERIPERGIYTENARLNRLSFIEKVTDTTFDAVKKSQLLAHRLTGNIENHIGGVEVPVGVAGPLTFSGMNVSGPIYAPLATSEGALVASASRGALLLSESGGVTTRIIGQRMIRIPMFVMDSLKSALFFSDWLKNHVDELQDVITTVSRHAKLTGIDITLTGRVIHASFIYSTGDAARQNMTTAATWHACQWALVQARQFIGVVVEDFLIDSGLSGDKKVNFKSFIEGRGTRVLAEAFIPGDILSRVMKVTPAELVHNYTSGLSALIQAGAIGSNINVANIIAAMFTATGQDIACVHESSLAHLFMEERDGGVYVNLTLPSLIVGTVGGGADLPLQREYLKMLDCYGTHKAGRLAEIIAGFCLALDLSTISAIVNGTFVKAHERLGRNRPVHWLKREEVTESFIETMVRPVLGESVTVKNLVRTNNFNATDSIITELSARNQEKFLGLYPLKFDVSSAGGGIAAVEAVLKSKPLDLEVIMLGTKMAGMTSAALGDLYEKFKLSNESKNCHIKELTIYCEKDPRFTEISPKYYGSYIDQAREAYVLLIERIVDPIVHGVSSHWSKEYLYAAVEGIAKFHSLWLGKEPRELPWIGFIHSAQSMVEQKSLFRELHRQGAMEFPEIVTGDVMARNYHIIDSIDKWWLEIDQMQKTLVHNDFNPRNIAIRNSKSNLQLCALDWELASFHIPQRDLAELLSFTADSHLSDDDIWGIIEHHRKILSEASGNNIEKDSWMRGTELAVWDFAVNRIGMYLMSHTFKHHSFMSNLVKNNSRLINLLKK